MSFAENYNSILKRIDAAQKLYEVKNDKVKIIAVSKTQTITKIQEALNFGQRLFGENKVQEAVEKWTDLKKNISDIELHLIGSLQTNKVKQAIALFDCIQTLDRKSLADSFIKYHNEGYKLPRLYVQINTGEEPQKGGILPQDLEEFMKYLKNNHLDIEGFMCVPPVEDEPALHFNLLIQFAKKFNIAKLSMGMSSDFETAILMQADYVRIGTALFGER
jgi:pyridoxal phosphate enzyme (YggS family)